MVKNEFGHSGLWGRKLTASQERMELTDFLYAGTISHKLKGETLKSVQR